MLRDLIERKVRGEEIVAPAIERPRPVTDLVKALRQSLEQRRPAAEAPRRGRRRKKAA